MVYRKPNTLDAKSRLVVNLMKSFWKNKKILITGSSGFIGKHVVKNLLEKRMVDKPQLRLVNSQSDDLRVFENAKEVTKDIDIILHLAANVGGVQYSSTHPATQFSNCSLIDLNVFEAATQNNVGKLVAPSSAVAYSPIAPSPLKESDLFLGTPAPSGYGYGFAKRNTVILAKAYHQEKGLSAVVVIPANSYGPGQSFDLQSGHVIPSLIYKCLTQPSLTVWGDGTSVRDFLYAEDFAEGVLLAAEKLNSPDPINLGSGVGVSIKQLVEEITTLCNFKGQVRYDSSKPGGQKERTVDISRARSLLAFEPSWSIHDGLKKTIEWIKKEVENLK